MKILAKPTPNPNVYDFVIEQLFYPTGSWQGELTGASLAFPLLQDLAALNGIEKLFVQANTMRVHKSKQAVWAMLAPKIGKVLRHWLQDTSEATHLLPPPQTAAPTGQRQTTPTAHRISVEAAQALVDTHLNPLVAQHGGHIRIDKLVQEKVFVTMSGGCQGCSQSTATLQQGLKTLLQRHYPELTTIVDTTRHEQGSNPYYARS